MDLRGADLSYTNLSYADLRYADLSLCDFSFTWYNDHFLKGTNPIITIKSIGYKDNDLTVINTEGGIFYQKDDFFGNGEKLLNYIANNVNQSKYLDDYKRILVE